MWHQPRRVIRSRVLVAALLLLDARGGAALAINICDVACRLLNDMATFAEADVSTRSPAVKTEEHK